IARERVPEQQPLNQVLIRHHAPALLEPVVDELATVAMRDDHAIDGEGLTVNLQVRDGVGLETLDHPAATGQAALGGVHRLTLALRGVVGDVEIDDVGAAALEVAEEVIRELERLDVLLLEAPAPSAPLLQLQWKVDELHTPWYRLDAR